MKHSVRTIVAAAAVTMVAGTASAQNIIIKSGPQGGVWYPISAGMASVLQDELGMQVTLQAGGGVSNAITTGRNEGHFGFTTPGAAAEVYKGSAERPAEDKLRTFGILYNQFFSVNLPADSDIASVADLAGKRIVTMRKGSSTEKMTQDVLAAHGLNYDDMASVNFAGSVGDATNQLRDGQVDAYLNLIAHPAGYMLELSSAMPMNLLSLDPEVIDKITSETEGYSEITLPAGTYDWQDEDVHTINGPVMMVTNADVPDDVVYQVAKALFENQQTLVDVHQVMRAFTPENAASNPPVPMHPGAERYFREVGALN